MNKFLKLPSDERRLYFEQAAIQKNISPVIMEKDFFVCWLLNILFESKFADSLVFKGGSSLSKVFGAINRFSEDIDLSLSPTFLELPEAATHRSQADKWWEKAETKCSSYILKIDAKSNRTIIDRFYLHVRAKNPRIYAFYFLF